METVRRNPKAVKIVIDVVCISSLTAALFVPVTPPHKGFACNDATIRLPQRPSSINTNAVFTWGYVIPVTIIILVETLGLMHRRRRSITRTLKVEFIWFLWNELLILFFGAMLQQLVIIVAKGTMGKLRPTFFAVCRPVNFTCTDDTMHVDEYYCENGNEDEVVDARSAFFSSHASFTFYVSVYTVLYLQHKVRWQALSLYMPVTQAAMVMTAIYVSLTRIRDNRHDATDVCFGALNGLIIALLVSLVYRRNVLHAITCPAPVSSSV